MAIKALRGFWPRLAAVCLSVGALGSGTNSARAQSSFDPFSRSPYADFTFPSYPTNLSLPNRALLSDYYNRSRSTRDPFNQMEALRDLDKAWANDPLGNDDPLRRFNSGVSRTTRTARYRNDLVAKTAREFYEKQRDADELYRKALREANPQKREELMREQRKLQDEIKKEISRAGRGKAGSTPYALEDDADLPKKETPRASSSAARVAAAKSKSKTPPKSQYSELSPAARGAKPSAIDRGNEANSRGARPSAALNADAGKKKTEASPAPSPSPSSRSVKPSDILRRGLESNAARSRRTDADAAADPDAKVKVEKVEPEAKTEAATDDQP